MNGPGKDTEAGVGMRCWQVAFKPFLMLQKIYQQLGLVCVRGRLHLELGAAGSCHHFKVRRTSLQVLMVTGDHPFPHVQALDSGTPPQIW